MTEHTNWQKFRKKPVVIRAYQVGEPMDIDTLEGTMHASAGDWIIEGVQGEMYPCKPDIFAETYTPVANEHTNARMTAEQLAAIERVYNKSTPGSWMWQINEDHSVLTNRNHAILRHTNDFDIYESDRLFIVLAHELMPALLSELRATQAERDKYHDLVSEQDIKEVTFANAQKTIDRLRAERDALKAELAQEERDHQEANDYGRAMRDERDRVQAIAETRQGRIRTQDAMNPNWQPPGPFNASEIEAACHWWQNIGVDTVMSEIINGTGDPEEVYEVAIALWHGYGLPDQGAPAATQAAQTQGDEYSASIEGLCTQLAALRSDVEDVKMNEAGTAAMLDNLSSRVNLNENHLEAKGQRIDALSARVAELERGQGPDYTGLIARIEELLNRGSHTWNEVDDILRDCCAVLRFVSRPRQGSEQEKK